MQPPKTQEQILLERVMKLEMAVLLLVNSLKMDDRGKVLDIVENLLSNNNKGR